MTNDGDRALMLKRAIELVFCEHRLDLIREFYHPDFQAEFPPPLGNVVGIDHHIALAGETFEAFPDFHEEMLDILPHGDRVAARFKLSGTQARPIWGFPCLGRRFEIVSMDIYEFQGRLICRQWGVMDVVGMHTQLGWPI